MSTSEKHDGKRIVRRPERARDFIVLTSGAAGLIALLVASGALGFIEGVMAAIVLFAGGLAYYVGSVPPEPYIDPRADAAGQPVTLDRTIRSLVHALPFPAVYISKDERIEVANQHAEKLFRISRIEGALKSVIIRQPDVLSATDRVARTGARDPRQTSRTP